jgi:tetratricopeptide (TPR) repeat protein
MDEQEALTILALAEECGAELKGLDAKTSLERLESRHADLRSAVAWFIEHGRADEAVRIAVSLPDFWSATARLEEGRATMDRALAAPATDERLRGRAFFEGGLLAFWQGDDERASSLHTQALELGRRLADPTVTALALSGLARIALRVDLEEARGLCRQALEVCSGTTDKLGRSNALHVLGVAAQMAGDLEDARELMTERLQLARELGSFAGAASEAGNLSVVERQLGNLARAEELALQALEISERRGDEWSIPYELNSLAAIAVERGDLARAAKLLGAAEAMMERQGTDWPPDEWPHFERTKARLVEETPSTRFRRSWREGRGMSLPSAVSCALGRARRPAAS